MIQVLYFVILAEMVIILSLVFKNPLRKLVIVSIDRAKRGRGPVMVKTVGGTVLIVFASSVYSMVKIQKRSVENGGVSVSPTDQVLMSKHLLEASLMGFLLFLSLMIDRLHHYIRELRLLRKTMEAAKRQNRTFEGKRSSTEEVKTLKEEVETLKGKITKLESELETKEKEAKATEAEAQALRKQSEGFVLEYDRLLTDNQNLRSQLESIEKNMSQYNGKKDI